MISINTLFFILAGLFWGGSFVAIKMVVEEIPPLWSAFFRLATALIFIVLIYALGRKSFAWPKNPIKIWSIGIIALGLPFMLLYWGELSVSAGLAGILNGTVPIWTYFLAVWFFRNEIPNFLSSSGVALGFVGVLIIFGPQILKDSSHSDSLRTFSVLCMAWSYALGTNLNRRMLNQGMDMYANLFHQILASTLFVGVVAFFIEGPPLTQWLQSQKAVWGTIYLGGASTALSFLFFYKLLKDWGSLRASSVTYVPPIISLTLDFFINQEVPPVSEVIGVFIILSGVILIQMARQREET